ncbi:MAG: glycosyltransferase family 4 protein [Methylococcaceae bacterium]
MAINETNISVLFLTKYARNGASSRYRSFYYFPFFEQQGIHCQISPLFDEQYLKHYYQHKRVFLGDVLGAFFRRVIALTTLKSFNLVVIEKELLPYFPPWLEGYLAFLKIPYVVDYDDALFHQYDQHKRGWVRYLLNDKIARVMRGAQLVSVGNAYLADYAHRAGATRVEIIPTVIDLERYPLVFDKPSQNTSFTIGWIGSPSTAKYLQAIAPVLANVCADAKGRVRLIGSGQVDLSDVPVDVLPWDEVTEVSALQQFDVGIMPLLDSPWERGKCGFKLIQYMACGLPVIASPVGVNCQIVEQGVNGFLAETPAQWQEALQTLLADAELRKRMGLAGRQKVEREYCLQVTAPIMAQLLVDVSTA